MLKSFLFEDLRIAQQDPLDITQLKALVVYCCLFLVTELQSLFWIPRSILFVQGFIVIQRNVNLFLTGPDRNIGIIKTIYNALLLG